MTFKTGDVVEMIAGGPRMTVEYFRPKSIENPVTGAVAWAGVGCVWFDTTNNLHRAVIPPELIRIYEIPDCSGNQPERPSPPEDTGGLAEKSL